MDEYLKKQTLERITNAQSILVAVSKRSGFDGLASGLAVYLSSKKLGKNVSICAMDPTVGDAQSLYGVDKIGKSEGKKDLVLVIDNAVKNVDKVTYFLENGVLKIVVHSFPDSTGVLKDDVSFEKAASKPDLIFAIGFNSLEELRNEIVHEQNISSQLWILSINKDSSSQKFAQINIHEHNAASVSEITSKLLQELALPVDEDISFNLYSGIKNATYMFSPKFAKPSSFEAAQYLIKLGAGKASLAETNEFRQSSTARQSKRADFGLGTSRKVIVQEDNQLLQSQPTDRSLFRDKHQAPIEDVEAKERSQKSWLKPPKIYRGSKSFDTES